MIAVAPLEDDADSDVGGDEKDDEVVAPLLRTTMGMLMLIPRMHDAEHDDADEQDKNDDHCDDGDGEKGLDEGDFGDGEDCDCGYVDLRR